MAPAAVLSFPEQALPGRHLDVGWKPQKSKPYELLAKVGGGGGEY